MEEFFPKVPNYSMKKGEKPFQFLIDFDSKHCIKTETFKNSITGSNICVGGGRKANCTCLTDLSADPRHPCFRSRPGDSSTWDGTPIIQYGLRPRRACHRSWPWSFGEWQENKPATLHPGIYRLRQIENCFELLAPSTDLTRMPHFPREPL